MRGLQFSAVRLLIGLALAGPAAAGAVTWSAVLDQPDAWYASAEARTIARSVLTWQTAVGGWPKNISMIEPAPAEPEVAESTIDNGATTTQLAFLARVVSQQDDDPQLSGSINRGIDYLLEAQYGNGGWPQFYPLRPGYYSHITYNDNAMVRVLRVLRAIAREEPPFRWVDPTRRARAAEALARGVDCVLRSQVRVDGELTAWCAQHDEVTLAPAPARKFEPISLSGFESAELLEFLMGEPEPSARLIAAVEAGVAWLEKVKLTGYRIERPPVASDPKRRDQILVKDPAGGAVWARFYELGTNRPIFAGRDAVIRYDLQEVEPERRSGYAYYGTWARRLIERDYPRWQKRAMTRLSAR